jgi:hypothetical protein
MYGESVVLARGNRFFAVPGLSARGSHYDHFWGSLLMSFSTIVEHPFFAFRWQLPVFWLIFAYVLIKNASKTALKSDVLLMFLSRFGAVFDAFLQNVW